MFDVVPNAISLLLTTLFPIFASYKALITASPSQLAPWLIYFLVINLFNLVEDLVSSFTILIPFYAWLRLFARLYLLLPGDNQGAKYLYEAYIYPFLLEHESQIEHFITTSHERARTAGLDYVKKAWDFVRTNLLGLPPSAATPAAAVATVPPSSTSYVQNLLARFSLPAAKEGVAAPASDIYNLLSTTLAQATSVASVSAQKHKDLPATDLVPPDMKTTEEKMSYISVQRERLKVLLQAFDRQASELAVSADSGPSAGIKKSKSELEFDTITDVDVDNVKEAKSAGWVGWMWSTKHNSSKAMSTGVDAKGKD